MNEAATRPSLSLRERLDDPLHAAAERFMQQGRVSALRVLQNGAVVSGIATLVSPSDSATLGGTSASAPMRAGTFRVYVRLGNGRIDGECSCRGTQPCIHVAAVLVEAARSAQLPGETAAAGRVALPDPHHAAQSKPLGQHLRYLLRLRARDVGATTPAEPCELSIWIAQAEGDSGSVGVAGPAPYTGPENARDALPFVPRALMRGERGTLDSADAFPRYVDTRDREILGHLIPQQMDGPWHLQGAAGAQVFRRIASTGRAYWQSVHGVPLRAGSPRDISFAWEVLPNGDQRLQHARRATLSLVLAMEPALYVDLTSGEWGELRLACPIELVRQYWNAAPVAPEQVRKTNAHIEGARLGATFPLLRELTIEKRQLTSVRGKLILASRGIASPPLAAHASLHFLYGDISIDSASLLPGQRSARRFAGDMLYEIDRASEVEQRLRTELAGALAQAAGSDPSRFEKHPEEWLQEELSRATWLSFMTRGVPALRAAGWQIEVDGTFPYRLAEPDHWYGDLQRETTRERDWFDLRLGVVVDGQTINLLPALVGYLQTTLAGDGASRPIEDPAYCRIDDRLFVRLEDGRYVPIGIDRIERIAQTLVELFDADTLSARESLQLPGHQLSRIAQLVGNPAALTDEAATPKSPAHDTQQPDSFVLQSTDSALLARIAEIRDFTHAAHTAMPAHFRTSLRSYQQEGLAWLQFLRRHDMGGILADDMGLGKTVQTLAHLALEKEQGRLRKPCLIVTPVSVIGHWERELRTLVPQLKVLTLHGPRRREVFAQLPRADIAITGYPLLQIDSDVLLEQEFYIVILDEAQTIKNPRAKVSQAARALRAEHRLCLTGTPIENHLGELWSLCEFLQQGMLGDEREFQRLYRTPIEKGGNLKRFHALKLRVAPFVLRRTKDAVAKELPPKTQIVESLVMEQSQRDFYDGIRLAMHRRVRDVIEEQGLARSHITVLDALLKLRQACCDPRLVRLERQAHDVPSAKLEWLTTMLPELIEEGRRVLLFSQFTSMLALIEGSLRELGIAYDVLTGETRNRTALVERFQSGAVPLLLISLKAGGTGLNLTAADTVIHYDPWWNPAAEAQATDRAHRIGQDKPVFVYKLIARGTVEEAIMQLQADKRALADQLYEPHGALPAQLTAADIENLFAS